MFDRISDLSNKSLSNGDTPSADELDGGPLAALLSGGESIQHVLAGSGGIDHTTNGRSTSIEPSGGHTAYMVVTDRTVYFVLGDDPETAEVTFTHANITTAELKSGLLNATILVKTADGSVRFTPKDADQGDVVADYTARLAAAWGEFDAALNDARDAIEDIEERLSNGKETSRLVQAARSYISNAHHAATYDEDAPTELMTELIEPIENDLDQLCVAIDTDQIESLLDEAREAKAEDDHETAFTTLAEAHSTIADGRKAVTDGGVLDAINELGSTYDELVTMTFEDAEAACHRGQSADDPADAVAAWREARQRYQAALSADWDGEASVSAEALEFQLAWVTQRLIDAHVDHADALEAEGDELGEESDEATDCYEQAREQLTRARELASQHTYATATVSTERLDDLEEKIELGEWQWGGAE
jgi:tetratricopeptide (TPR) repeat protein